MAKEVTMASIFTAVQSRPSKSFKQVIPRPFTRVHGSSKRLYIWEWQASEQGIPKPSGQGFISCDKMTDKEWQEINRLVDAMQKSTRKVK